MEWIYIVLSFPVGILLGAFFFQGLWWTVNKLTTTHNQALLFVASFLLRMGVVLAGFYGLLLLGVPHLLVALAGFFASRVWYIWTFKPKEPARIAGDGSRGRGKN